MDVTYLMGLSRGVAPLLLVTRSKCAPHATKPIRVTALPPAKPIRNATLELLNMGISPLVTSSLSKGISRGRHARDYPCDVTSDLAAPAWMAPWPPRSARNKRRIEGLTVSTR